MNRGDRSGRWSPEPPTSLSTNPLLREVLAGIGQVGPAHFTYLGYLGIQALVVFLAWPKSDLYHMLATGSAPQPLLAVVITLGATLAYYSLRAGAEEFVLPGQHSLGEWALTTRLGLGRILRGYLAGHCLQTLHAVVLSSPLLLAAFSVSGGTWSGLAWSLAAILVQAAFYRLVGALVYLTIGDKRVLTLLCLRALVLLGYAVTVFALPLASHLVISYRLLNARSIPPNVTAVSDQLAFVLVYAGLCALLMLLLHRLLSRHRRLAGALEAKLSPRGSGSVSVSGGRT